MSKYILNTLKTTEQMDAILKENVCFPLVREIEFKYGLKVYKIKGKQEEKATPTFYLCYPNGLPCGVVFAKKHVEWDIYKGTHVPHWEYCFRTPYYKKARASSDSDRQTISSKKISTLMGTIQRQKVIGDVSVVFKDFKNEMVDAKETMVASFGKSNKYESVNMDTIHALVAHALGENPDKYNLSLDLDLCKILLDKFNKADSIRAEKVKESDRFFGNPFYAIGVDRDEHIIIGKFKLVGDVVTILEDFSRVQSLDHKVDLLPILTMMKVAYEGKNTNDNHYDGNLDVIHKSVFYRDERDFKWTFIPCP